MSFCMQQLELDRPDTSEQKDACTCSDFSDMLFLSPQQENTVLAWIFSLFVEAPKSQFQHEQFSEQLLAGKQTTNVYAAGRSFNQWRSSGELGGFVVMVTLTMVNYKKSS